MFHDENHCPFDLWAPDKHEKVRNVAFSVYAFTTELIEDFIDALAAVDDPNDEWEQRRIAMSLGINIDRLSDSEIKYIEEEVAMRR